VGVGRAVIGRCIAVRVAIGGIAGGDAHRSV
jgi:hypothetical protein